MRQPFTSWMTSLIVFVPLAYEGKESAYASPQKVFKIIKGADAGQPGELKLNVIE